MKIGSFYFKGCTTPEVAFVGSIHYHSGLISEKSNNYKIGVGGLPHFTTLTESVEQKGLETLLACLANVIY